MYDMDLKELGLNKLNYWGFENEWRYKINLMVAIHGSKNVIGKQFAVESPDCIDVSFNETIEEIVTALKIDNSDLDELALLLSKNNINISIRQSRIHVYFLISFLFNRMQNESILHIG